jgi:hypothetical protein
MKLENGKARSGGAFISCDIKIGGTILSGPACGCSGEIAPRDDADIRPGMTFRPGIVDPINALS